MEAPAGWGARNPATKNFGHEPLTIIGNNRETIMALPPKKQKKAKRSSRFRSQRHLTHVRTFACAMCFSEAGVQAAHVRMESGAGMGEKPDDWRWSSPEQQKLWEVMLRH